MFFSRSSSISFCFLPVSIFSDFLIRLGFFPIIGTPGFDFLDDHCQIRYFSTVSSVLSIFLDLVFPVSIILDL
ncbi:hypothetical protein CARUB_v10012764mg [Capsella rubella]|uniref:Uncharacterized protein n=1 Tax=Capsella rubella TaxID=81985 RepID=R0ETU7_9BRAS|nr:hypothetical protein CARUB_v10012762mg [Capsella rubella]EOA12221.1 hypothetical protein CARUB_v10012764mg [Capsella rubella]